MTRKKAAVSVVVFGCALTSQGVAQGLDAEALQEILALVGSPDRLIAESTFELSEQTVDSIAGQLDVEYDSQWVGFESVMATPTLVRLRLELGDVVVLEAESDLAANTRLLDGHGHALTIGQRVALQALTTQLERHLQPYQNLLPPHEDFLFRVVSYWGEAPVGWHLERRVVTLRPRDPLQVAERRSPEGSVALTCGGGPEEPENPSDFGDDCEDGEDGIVYYSNPCDCFPRLACHDAHSFPLICGIHGMGCESVGVGCDLNSDCLGRCGPGCGSDGGVGAYTWDCADHDRCCQVHGGCFNPT